ncbi:sugar ABC transporter permease [Sulfitobacter sp. SK012]|uniref:sugar ABC transporter permease n=1 Tax=Sulfitobacter sp. SK012 TaxID=1389005 RepID=UPI000E0AA3AE|nr:sugar ABC transporter permease [Sulfitobacter sp. SK012]AXI47979.1 sugar ABC transporter permease [Sulfitobacter sp. SK012]
MSDATQTAPPRSKSFLKSLELDTRLLGMIGAFFVIAAGFHLYTGYNNAGFSLGMFTEGTFLTPRNIFNLTIQTASVGIMATGMVFIIVMRHIDLSVGALLATCSAVMAMTQTAFLPDVLGLPLGHPMIPWIAILAGLITGAAIGAAQGWLVGYQLIPAFIVTLGGLLIWRNVGWFMTDGATIGPLDPTFQLFGGINGTLGAAWSWIVGLIAAATAAWLLINARRTRVGHGFPVKPVAAEVTIGAILMIAILGFVAVLNAYNVPERVVARDFAEYGCESAEVCAASYGLPISVLVLLVVAITMTVVAQRTRLGRYIFATGGNPDATELTGVNTRLLTVKIFAIMGLLCAIGAIVASARQTYHTNDIGTLDELRVIAAAVIGGTALSGGIGTIYGAIIGALIMQSLQSGMAMVNVDAPYQNIVVGAVLVFAVWVDIIYRKRLGAK